MNDIFIGGRINRTRWFIRCGRQEKNKGVEFSGWDIGWTTGLFTDTGNTGEKPVWVGWGENMTSNSILDKLSFRCFLDSQGELTAGSMSL